MKNSRCLLARPWRSILLAAALAPGTSAVAGASLAIVPAHPTADDSIELLVTIDGFSPCGAAAALLPFEPDDHEINVMRAFFDFDLSCPASVELVTVRFRLGRLAPGTHQVKLYTAAVPGSPAELDEAISFVVAAGASSEHLLLQGGRFEVDVTWRDFVGATGGGLIVPGAADDSGLFWFFTPANWELLVKILDGCGVNGHYWVLGSGATNVEFTLNVRDTVSGRVWTHVNPLHTPAGTWSDTSAFLCVVP